MEETKEGVYYKRPISGNEILEETKPVHKKLGAAGKILVAVIGVAGFVFLFRGLILIGIIL